ncbi:MAG: SDR family NAD(P)-dependent oxidoreductase [Rhodobacteraceae bacterium]|nr:MAG: SDR family NAD(P)-dependent oxidoreductase [Paracoccaceae bacterium]
MPSRPAVHRLKTFAARAWLAGRRVVEHFRRPDAVEMQMANLPRVEAGAGLAGRVAMVTGAGQGIGRVVALAFAAEGARVVLVSRSADKIAAVADEARKAGGVAHPVAGDVADPSEAGRLLDAAEAAFGPVDVLVNNAGVGGPWGKPFWEIEPEGWAEAMATNLGGPFLLARAAAARASAAGRGLRIINVSSIATEGAHANIAAYVTSKAALEALTRQMALDAGRAGIVAVAVSLDSVQTERKRAHDWASTALLPPTEAVVPAFLHAASAPAAEVQGRTIAAWRFRADPEAEARLAGPAAGRRPIAYPPFIHRGVETARDPARFTILDRAENAWGTSPAVGPAMAQAASKLPLAYYPEERHDGLVAALSTHLGLPPTCFAVGPGSWEVLSRLVGLLVKPGEEVVSNAPGWFGFNLVCDQQGARRSMAPFDLGETSNRPGHNLRGLLDRIGPMTRLVYLIHPANPEGVALQASEMREFLAEIPPRLPVVVDEAYIEYAEGEDLFDTVAAVRDGDRTVIGLRTFSKFYGLAGARVGYAYAKPEVADLIRRQEKIFSLASVSEAAAVAALRDREHAGMIRAAFLSERRRLTAALAERGLAPLPSQAPYVLARRPKGAEAMFDMLENNGLYIARYAFHGDRYIMFPVGRPEATDRMLSTLDAIGRKESH